MEYRRAERKRGVDASNRSEEDPDFKLGGPEGVRILIPYKIAPSGNAPYTINFQAPCIGAVPMDRGEQILSFEASILKIGLILVDLIWKGCKIYQALYGDFN